MGFPLFLWDKFEIFGVFQTLACLANFRGRFATTERHAVTFNLVALREAMLRAPGRFIRFFARFVLTALQNVAW